MQYELDYACIASSLLAIFDEIGVQRVDSITATMVRSLIMAGTLVFAS